MEVYQCSICDMKFRSIEELPGKWRLQHHKNTEHLAACEQCGKAFVSHSHATIHLYQCHNIKCIRCGQVCDGKCLVDIVMSSESADSDVRKKMLNEVENQIKKEESRYLTSFLNIPEGQMKQLMNMIWALDTGFSGCMTNSWGMLNYLPFIELSKKLGELTKFGQEFVMRHQYLSAMVKLNRYLANKKEVSALIADYSIDCLRVHNENGILSMSPERLAGIELCFPEREIGEPRTGLWVKNMYKESSEEKDQSLAKKELQFANISLSYQLEVPVSNEEFSRISDLDTSENTNEEGEVLAVDEPKLISMSDSDINKEHSSDAEIRALDKETVPQQEAKTSNKDTEWLGLDNTDVGIIAEDSSTDEPSVTLSEEVLRTGNNDKALVEARHGLSSDNINSILPEGFESKKTCKEKGIVNTTKDDVTEKRDAASNTNIEIKDMKENELGSDPVLSPGKMNGASNRKETIDPLEMFNEIDTIKSTDKPMTGVEVKPVGASTDLTSLEVDVPHIIDHIPKVENNDKYGSCPLSRSDNKSRIILSSEGNTYDVEKSVVVEKEEDVAFDTDKVFAFETFSEEDELGRWLYRAEYNSLMQGSDNSSDTTKRIVTEDTVEKDDLDSTKTTTAGDIERIKLIVKENAFVSANGIKIEENTELSSDIRSLMDHFVSKEEVSKADSDEGSNTKGLIDSACKTIVTVVNIEDDGIKPNDIDIVSDCHKGHPELSSSDLGHLKLCNDPKPRIVKEGSEVLILGSVLIGKRPHWLQGEIKDTLEHITVNNRDINEAVGMTIHNPMFINYRAERCSLKIQETVTILIDEVLVEALESVVANEDIEMSEKSSIHEKYGVVVDSEVDENSVIEGLELQFSYADLKPEIDEAGDMLLGSGMKIELVLQIEASPPGKGFVTLDENWEEKKKIKGKNIPAVIAIIIEKKNNGRAEIIHGFLNGVPRRITFDSCANSSFIINTKNSKRSRKFKIVESSMSYISDAQEFTNRYQSDDEDDDDSDDNPDYKAWFALDSEREVELPMPGLEVRFSLKDILVGLRQNENVMNSDNNTAVVTLMAKISSPGTGFLDSSNTDQKVETRTISGRLSLILRKTEEGNIEISRCFLNGIRREMVVEFEALKSVIFITERPWRSRCFSIENIDDSYDKLKENRKPDEKKTYTGMNNSEATKNDEQNNFHIKTKDGSYLICKNNSTACTREKADSLDNLLTEEDVRNIQRSEKGENQQASVSSLAGSDDPRKGGKVGSKQDQEETLEVDSVTNKVSYEVTTPSNTEISVLKPLRKMHNIVSEAVQKMFHFKERSQSWNTVEKKEINASETKRESNQSRSKTENDLSQPCTKHEIKLRNKNRFEPLSVSYRFRREF